MVVKSFTLHILLFINLRFLSYAIGKCGLSDLDDTHTGA